MFGGEPIVRDMPISAELILSLLAPAVTPVPILDDSKTQRWPCPDNAGDHPAHCLLTQTNRHTPGAPFLVWFLIPLFHRQN